MNLTPPVFLAFVFSLALTACTGVGAASARTAALGEPITLAPGESARITGHDLEVRFVRVLEDSRCPIDATCVWAGEVKAELTLRSGDGEEHMEVIAGQSAVQGAWRVELLSVQPERESSASIDAADYRATVLLRSLERP